MFGQVASPDPVDPGSTVKGCRVCYRVPHSGVRQEIDDFDFDHNGVRKRQRGSGLECKIYLSWR
jgi:hypothetical protein